MNKRIKYIKGDTVEIEKILYKYKKNIKVFFTLENFLEFIKALKSLKNVFNQILLVHKLFLNFV